MHAVAIIVGFYFQQLCCVLDDNYHFGFYKLSNLQPNDPCSFDLEFCCLFCLTLYYLEVRVCVCVCVCVRLERVYVHHMHADALRGQRRASDPLELKLHILVSICGFWDLKPSPLQK